jgi:hypothetical protein
MMMMKLIIGRLIGRALGFQVGQKEETSNVIGGKI